MGICSKLYVQIRRKRIVINYFLQKTLRKYNFSEFFVFSYYKYRFPLEIDGFKLKSLKFKLIF